MCPPARVDDISLEPNPVIELYKKDVDRSLLRENLKLTHEQRILKLQDFVRFLAAMQDAGTNARPRR